MTATAFGAALSAAGRNTSADRLYVAAVKALQDADLSVTDAIRTFGAAVKADPELFNQLAAEYLRRVSEDMRGLPGGGRGEGDTHRQTAPARQPNGDDAGQRRYDTQRSSVSTPHANGAGQVAFDTHYASARPVREPSPVQRAAAASVHKAAAVTILDTYKIRDGRAIGDVRFGEVDRLRLEDVRHASVWRQIQLAHPNTPHDMKLRDVLKAEELQRFQQRAAEVADAT